MRATPPVQVGKITNFENWDILRRTTQVEYLNSKKIEVNFEFFKESKMLFSECNVMYPRSFETVINAFRKSFEFYGSFDIESGEKYFFKR